MKAAVLLGLTVLIAAANAVRLTGVCPPSSGLSGFCVFDPKVNCLQDTQCAHDEKCCSEGCNKVCKKILQLDKSHSGTCPAPSGMVSICVFRPGYNCLNDIECGADQKCCSEGCGKICKTALH